MTKEPTIIGIAVLYLKPRKIEFDERKASEIDKALSKSNDDKI